MNVFLQHRNAETVECADVARIVVARQRADARAHFRGRLVREGDAENVRGENP